MKQALLKEQWVITADPLKIKIEGVTFEIDLAFVQEALKIYQVKLIVYQPQKEIIIVWKE